VWLGHADGRQVLTVVAHGTLFGVWHRLTLSAFPGSSSTKIKDFREELDWRFQNMTERFDAVDARLSHLTSAFTEIVRGLDDRDEHLARLKSLAKVIDKMRARVVFRALCIGKMRIAG
jgi:hypothetical protein